MYFPFDVSTSLGKKTIGEKKNVNKVEPVLSLLNGKASEKGVPKKKKKAKKEQMKVWGTQAGSHGETNE